MMLAPVGRRPLGGVFRRPLYQNPTALDIDLGEIVEETITNVDPLVGSTYSGLPSIELFDGAEWAQSATTTTGTVTIGADLTVDISAGAVDEETADSFVFRIVDDVGASEPATASYSVIEAEPPAIYDELVLALAPVSYYPLAAVSPSVLDQRGVQNGALAAGTAQTGQPTIADDDPSGLSIGLLGTEQITIAYNAAHKTAAGGVAVMIQPKSTGAKQVLAASDSSNSAGGWSLEREDNGQLRAFLRNAAGTPVVLTSSTGVSLVGDAIHVAFTWGAAGLKLYADGSLVDSDAETDGADGGSLSGISVGRWHTSTTPYAGLLAKLVLFASQPSDADVLSIALPLDATSANDDDIGEVEVSDAATGLDPLANDHFQGSGTIAITAQGSLGTWSGTGPLTYTAGAVEGPDFDGRYTVNGGAPAILKATVVDTPGSPGSNDQLALVMAAPGQISDVDILDADVYYRSNDIDDTIRDGWNDQVEPYRWTFTKVGKPRLFQNINSKTRICGRSLYNHSVIMPATAFSDEVLVQPTRSNDGCLRATSQNKTGWDGGGTDGNFRNFRKHDCNLRRRIAHSAYDSIGDDNKDYDYLHYGQTYESGFTFWQGGTADKFYAAAPPFAGACAMMQVHGTNPAIYFFVGTGGNFTGFTRTTPGAAQDYFPGFNRTTGYNDIHVLKFSFRLGTGGHLKIWYNGVLKVDVSRTIDPGPAGGDGPLQDICFTYRDPWTMDSSTGESPSVIGGSSTEVTVYFDRVWKKAI